MTLDEIAETVREEYRDWFLERIRRVGAFARVKFQPRQPASDPKRLLKDLAALRRTREILSHAKAEATVLLAVDREIWTHESKLSGFTWTAIDAIQHAETGILDALARARGVHLGRLRPGRSPEGVPLTQDSAIVHSLLLNWGLHQQEDTTFKHVRKAVNGARADAEFAESWGDPPRLPEPEIDEGTTRIVF